MSLAYLDTSFLVAVLFAEPGSTALQRTLGRFDELVSSDLLVAETLSAARREGLDASATAPALEGISLVFPERSLGPELREALSHGPLRGADLFHVACATYVAGPARSRLAFLSRDLAQRRVARRMGFATP